VDTNNAKKVWLYYRLSRDEDKELNSLGNQRQILYDYAKAKHYEIVGESCDDNVSGMHFERKGIEELQEAVDNNLIELVLVKDLSRLGRHKTQTAIFIDYLKASGVGVYSVTENINTLNENDDLIIGFKGLINDSYAKDISKKIRNGYKQKQKQGIVIIPPFGYIKDAITKNIVIVEECANIVRLIYKLHNDGLGAKKIAIYLTDNGYKTPSYYQLEHYNKSNPPNRTKMANRWMWHDRTISAIVRNEAYVGTLICGRTYRNTINKTRGLKNESEQYRHENYYPPIIDSQTWEIAQTINHNRLINNVRASNNHKIYKYSGLIKCGECGAGFVAKNRSGYIEYVCNSYHRFGAKYCTPHRIKESDLDNLLLQYLFKLKEICGKNLEYINKEARNALEGNNLRQIIEKYQKKIDALTAENKNALKQILKHPNREIVLNEIIDENENSISGIKELIENVQKSIEMVEQSKKSIQDSTDILTDALTNKRLSSSDIQTFVSKIIISANPEGNLHLEFALNTAYNLNIEFNNIYTEGMHPQVDIYSVINKFMR